MNKYLEKIAGIKDKVDSEMENWWYRKEEIERPIREMRSRIDALHNNPYSYSDDESHQEFANQLDRMSDYMKDSEERHLRANLKIDEQHTKNDTRAAKALLLAKNMNPSSVKAEPIQIINTFKNLPGEDTNWYTALKNLGTVGGGIAGGFGGAAAGMHLNGVGSGVAGALLGATVGGVGSYYGLKKLLTPAIEAKDKRSYDKSEQQIIQAYELIKKKYT